jgi:hypothetical protein
VDIGPVGPKPGEMPDPKVVKFPKLDPLPPERRTSANAPILEKARAGIAPHIKALESAGRGDWATVSKDPNVANAIVNAMGGRNVVDVPVGNDRTVRFTRDATTKRLDFIVGTPPLERVE